MIVAFIVFVSLAALLHILFFKIESLDFTKPIILKRFGLSRAQSEYVKIWAFNQGFYNLFLALGLVYALFLLFNGQAEQGIVLAQFILATLAGAGCVLLYSAPEKYPAALAQAVPALLGLIISFFL